MFMRLKQEPLWRWSYLVSRPSPSSERWLYAPEEEKEHSHVFNSQIPKDLTVVYVPDRLVVPDFRAEEDSTQDNSFPITGHDVNLGIYQQSLQVDLVQRRSDILETNELRTKRDRFSFQDTVICVHSTATQKCSFTCYIAFESPA